MDTGGILVITLGLCALMIYTLPIIVAMMRGRAVAPVTIITLFLGWTLIGWVGALVWACTERTAKEEASHQRA
jgi:hypothetical protein